MLASAGVFGGHVKAICLLEEAFAFFHCRGRHDKYAVLLAQFPALGEGNFAVVILDIHHNHVVIEGGIHLHTLSPEVETEFVAVVGARHGREGNLHEIGAAALAEKLFLVVDGDGRIVRSGQSLGQGRVGGAACQDCSQKDKERGRAHGIALQGCYMRCRYNDRFLL